MTFIKKISDLSGMVHYLKRKAPIIEKFLDK